MGMRRKFQNLAACVLVALTFQASTAYADRILEAACSRVDCIKVALEAIYDTY